MAKMKWKAREAKKDRQEVRLVRKRNSQKKWGFLFFFSDFTWFWGFTWRCNKYAFIWKYWSNAKVPFQLAAVTLRGAESQEKESKRPGERSSSRAVLEDTEGPVVLEASGALLSGLSRWCSVRGCLEDSRTIWSLLASPKRYREFKIPNFTYNVPHQNFKAHSELCLTYDSKYNSNLEMRYKDPSRLI